MTLDFDQSIVIVTDALGSDESETSSLSDFLDQAAAFGDDPSFGDGLTLMQRSPPTYEVAPDGTASRIAEPPNRT